MPASHLITAKERGLTRRQDKTNAAIIAEAVNVLKARGDFDHVVRYGFETPDWACSGRQG